MPIEVVIKPALVKISEYSFITDPTKFKDYMNDSIRTGKASDFYKDPNITTVYYNAGKVLADAIKTAVDKYTDAPIDANKERIEVAMASGLVWMNGYAAQVQVIANLPANRATQDEAATNILQSFLKYQALTKTMKSTPENPELSGKVVAGPGAINVNIVNGATFNPLRTVIVSVSEPLLTNPITPPSIVNVVDGQLNIETFGPSTISVNVIPGKGRLAKFKSLVTGICHDSMDFVPVEGIKTVLYQQRLL